MLRAMAWPLMLIPAAGFAQDCGRLPATAIGVESLGSSIAKMRPRAIQRGEFETNAAFEARAKATSSDVAESMVVSWSQPDLANFDADTGDMIVTRYAVTSTCGIFPPDAKSGLASVQIGQPAKYDWETRSPRCLTKDVSSRPGESYRAGNAYGATVTVHHSVDTGEGIFLGMGLPGTDYFPARDFSGVNSSPWLRTKVTPEEARSLKANAELIFVVSPKSPFYGTGRYYIEPTIDAPQSISIRYQFLVGTPICVALADHKTGKIFASRPFVIGEFGQP